MICSRHSHSHSHSHSHNKTLTTTTTAMSSLLVLVLALTLTAPSHPVAAAAPLKAGDTICTEGYIMDTFCIDRGTLLDNPTVVTLEQPEEHSIHCLVDVNSCVSSPFEVLLDPTTTTGDNNNNNNKNLYSRGWRLDEESQKQAIALARTVGTCSTCTTSTDVAVPHAKGFRAAIKAVILNLNEDDPSIPPTIQALGMEDTTAYNKRKSKSNDVGVDFDVDFDVENVGVAGVSACQNFFQMEDIADVVVVAVDDDAPCPTTTTSAAAAALKAGDEICTEGFVMDQFCIDRGTLFDNPSVKTLEGPEKHSVHCLIDVESCVSSNFEILLDPPPPPSDPTTSSSSTADGGGGGSYYTRGWRLDADSKQRAVELAKSVGTCTDCMEGNTEENSHVRGFRVVTRAVVLDLNTDDDSVPPTIQVLDMEDTTAYSAGSSSSSSSSACQTFFGMNDIVDQHRSSSSCGAAANNGSGSLLAGIAVDGGGSQNALRTKHFAHASLMLIGWGFLLPTGALTAKFFKHRPNGLWFRYHRILQTLGLAVALVGWIIALLNFNVFMDYGFRNFQHGVCGMVVMILGLLQPLNAFFRPHHHHPPLLSPGDDSNNNNNNNNNSDNNNSKSKARVIWEIVHKTSGWLAVALAVPTIVLGTKSLPVPDDQTKFQIGYGVGCIGGLLLLLAYMFYDKTNYATTNTDANADGEESPDKEC